MRKMVLFLAFVAASCTNDLGRDTLLIGEMKLVHRDGTPAANVVVNVFNHDSLGWPGSELAKTTTDPNGNARLVFPETDGPYGFSVYDNREYFGSETLGFTSEDFSDYTVVLPQMTVYRKSEAVILQLIPTRISDASILSLWISGSPIPEDPDGFPTNHPEDDYVFKTRHDVLKNSTITVHYLIEESGEIMEMEFDLNIGESDLTHYLEY